MLRARFISKWTAMFLSRKPLAFSTQRKKLKDKQSFRKKVTIKMQSQIIGISGVAGSGKDTFYSLLSEALPCVQFSLADELKQEVRQWCKMHYHIDSVNCRREDKEIIRPLLVAHGVAKRNLSDGRHWIDLLNDKLIKNKDKGFKVITDIRYDDFENDEVSWLKNELNGILVHVSQYSEGWSHYQTENGKSEWSLVKEFIGPANEEEARNDLKLKHKSDFQVEWGHIENGQIDELSPYVDNFVRWLTKRKK